MAYTEGRSTREVDPEKSASSMTSNKNEQNGSDGPDDLSQEILALQDMDPSMDKKMHLVNNVSIPCLCSNLNV